MRFLLNFGIVLLIAVALFVVVTWAQLVTTGGLCSWPHWSKPYIGSAALGLCK